MAAVQLFHEYFTGKIIDDADCFFYTTSVQSRAPLTYTLLFYKTSRGWRLPFNPGPQQQQAMKKHTRTCVSWGKPLANTVLLIKTNRAASAAVRTGQTNSSSQQESSGMGSYLMASRCTGWEQSGRTKMHAGRHKGWVRLSVRGDTHRGGKCYLLSNLYRKNAGHLGHFGWPILMASGHVLST
jgi:hypothetical protein